MIFIFTSFTDLNDFTKRLAFGNLPTRYVTYFSWEVSVLNTSPLVLRDVTYFSALMRLFKYVQRSEWFPRHEFLGKGVDFWCDSWFCGSFCLLICSWSLAVIESRFYFVKHYLSLDFTSSMKISHDHVNVLFQVSEETILFDIMTIQMVSNLCIDGPLKTMAFEYSLL